MSHRRKEYQKHSQKNLNLHLNPHNNHRKHLRVLVHHHKCHQVLLVRRHYLRQLLVRHLLNPRSHHYPHNPLLGLGLNLDLVPHLGSRSYRRRS
jgi:hypothetical protein